MEERTVLERFIEGKGLRHSKPREQILDVFLGIEQHVTVDELWAAVRKKHEGVGYATVYRTLKLLTECGLCSELTFEDGTTRYEHSYGHSHHDHLVCTSCGKCIEVVDSEIEKLQERLVKPYGFALKYHRMNLYGTCKDCTAAARRDSKEPSGKGAL
jgi:Fur family ferric uptake transcriptional regulator